MEDIKVLIADDQGLIQREFKYCVKYGRSTYRCRSRLKMEMKAVQLCDKSSTRCRFNGYQYARIWMG